MPIWFCAKKNKANKSIIIFKTSTYLMITNCLKNCKILIKCSNQAYTSNKKHELCMKYVRSFCVAIDAGDIKMFFSLMLIFMCCVNTVERLFLFTRKNQTVFLQCEC